jgi:hypothetical protein
VLFNNEEYGSEKETVGFMNGEQLFFIFVLILRPRRSRMLRPESVTASLRSLKRLKIDFLNGKRLFSGLP